MPAVAMSNSITPAAAWFTGSSHVAQTFPGFDVVAFNAMIGPAGIPPPVLEKLSTYVGAVVDSPEFAERTRSLGIDAKSMTPHELDQWFDKELARWTEIAREANLKPE